MTLYNCIDMEKIEMAFYSRQTARTQLNIPENIFLFGTLGRLAKEKRLRQH